MAEKFDVAVIGGGPAGYIAAIKASQLGGRVALVEKDELGGTCLNRGCIPTKTYLKNAEIIESMMHSSERGIGIDTKTLKIDIKRTVEYKNSVVKTLTSGIAGLLKSNGVKVYKGTGKITKERKVIVDDKEEINANKIIIASGSKAIRINIPGIESRHILTSDEILELKEIPNKLAVIGGGVVGIEFATAFNAFGSEVTVIELEDRILPFMDKDISNELTKELTTKGIRIINSKKIEEIIEKSGKLMLKLSGNEEVKADKALLSIGRSPDIEALGEVKVSMERGRIKVNEYMETSIEGIYAPGDVNGRSMLAHAAFKMGEVAAMNAMGKKEKADLKNVPSCVYTFPEIGTVGLSEDKAKEKYDVSIGKFPFAANGRALASGERQGFVKVVADKKYGEVLGVHIIGPGAAEMINEAASLMEMQITTHEISGIIHAHPTYSEAFMEAAADSLGKCMHLPKK